MTLEVSREQKMEEAKGPLFVAQLRFLILFPIRTFSRKISSSRMETSFLTSSSFDLPSLFCNLWPSLTPTCIFRHEYQKIQKKEQVRGKRIPGEERKEGEFSVYCLIRIKLWREWMGQIAVWYKQNQRGDVSNEPWIVMRAYILCCRWVFNYRLSFIHLTDKQMIISRNKRKE